MAFLAESSLSGTEFRADIATVIAVMDIVGPRSGITGSRMGIDQQAGAEIPAPDIGKGRGMRAVAAQAHDVGVGIRTLAAVRIEHLHIVRLRSKGTNWR